jgi:ABC-type multidrug transport system ATPase subunit
MQASSDVVIQVENISKAFGSLQAVDGLSFEVYRGEIFGLLGPNGAGMAARRS